MGRSCVPRWDGRSGAVLLVVVLALGVLCVAGTEFDDFSTLRKRTPRLQQSDVNGLGSKSQRNCTAEGPVEFAVPTTQYGCEPWQPRRTYNYDSFKHWNKVAHYECDHVRVIVSNGIPDHQVYLANDNAACERAYAVVLPLNGTTATISHDIHVAEASYRGIIGFATNGVPIFGPQADDGTGHNVVEPPYDYPDQSGQYWFGHANADKAWHYHSPYLGYATFTGTVDSDTVLGWAMDGWPIMGPVSDATALDDCGGIELAGGGYQYHVRLASQVDATGDFCDKRWSYAGPGCLVGKDAMNHYSQVYDFVVEATPLESLPYVANCALVDSVPDINNNVDVLQVKASDGSWDGNFSITSHAPTVSPTLSPTVSPTLSPTTSPTSRPTFSTLAAQLATCTDPASYTCGTSNGTCTAAISGYQDSCYNLSFGDVSGTIPANIADFIPNVTTLEFGSKKANRGDKGLQELTGNIPTEIGLLTSLTVLAFWEPVRGKGLIGTIPTEIGQLVLLKELHLDRNHLTGTIPSEIALIAGLSILHLEDNKLSGSLPSQLASMTGFVLASSSTDPTADQGLWLSGNHGLCGTIPSVLSSDTFLLRTTDDDSSGWTVRPDQTDLGGTCFGMPCCSVAKLIPEFCCVAEQFPDITNKLCDATC